jgi:DNA-binding PadR family transcriptional regulator
MNERASHLPRYTERHALQILLSGDWKASRVLYSTGSKTLTTMVVKGWIEVRRSDKIEYRITAAGLEAFQTPLP